MLFLLQNTLLKPSFSLIKNKHLSKSSQLLAFALFGFLKPFRWEWGCILWPTTLIPPALSCSTEHPAVQILLSSSTRMLIINYRWQLGS